MSNEKNIRHEVSAGHNGLLPFIPIEPDFHYARLTNSEAGVVWVGNELVTIGKKQLIVLQELHAHANDFVTIERLAVFTGVPTSSVLEDTVRILREKLPVGPVPGQEKITGGREAGYMLIVPSTPMPWQEIEDIATAPTPSGNGGLIKVHNVIFGLTKTDYNLLLPLVKSPGEYHAAEDLGNGTLAKTTVTARLHALQRRFESTRKPSPFSSGHQGFRLHVGAK